MKKKAHQLEFISWIHRDGKGTEIVPLDMLEDILENNEVFEVNNLSLKHSTFIASGFNSFVVKVIGKKDNPKAKPNV